MGRVGRPHALDGAFFVEDASTAAERFAPGATVHVDGRPARVLESKRSGGKVVIRLDRAVERGMVLEVRREDLLPAPDDSYYVFDLLGLEVQEEGGRALGRVVDVSAGVANDVLELDSGLLLPLGDACVREIDLAAGTIVVAPGFSAPE